MNLNQAVMIGRLTRDIEAKELPSGLAVANFTLAVNRPFRTADGQWREHVAFVPCSAYGPLAIRLKDATKGSTALVVGYLRTESWEDGGKKRERLVLICDNAMKLQPTAPKTDDEGSPAPETALLPF